jgi:ribose transport system substrate-binding protein
MKQRIEGGAARDPYLVDAVMRACDLIEAFRELGETLRLRDLVSRTRMNKSRVFRILHTLERRGLVERVGPQEYRSRFGPLMRRKHRIGYAAQSLAFPFVREVTDGLARAAAENKIDLLVLDNRYSARVAVKNAAILLRERVDLIVEFQTDERSAPVISAQILDGGIPLIAMGMPHPGGTFYGIDNYRAGLSGGRHLGRWAKLRWKGAVDQVLLLELSAAGALPRSRLAGTLAGIAEVLPRFDHSRTAWLDGNGEFWASLEAVRKHLRHTRPQRTLVGALNDSSALGALRAFEEAGRAEFAAVLGQGGSIEGRAELRTPGSRFVGTVGFFPERYGAGIIALALDILAGKPVPPAVFVKHQLLTASNVDQFYPNDGVMTEADLDALLCHLPHARMSR